MFHGGRSAAVATTLVVLATAYVVGNLLGRSVDRPGSTGAAAPVAEGSLPDGSPNADGDPPASGPSGEAPPDGQPSVPGEPPSGARAAGSTWVSGAVGRAVAPGEPAAVHRPVAEPGRPPLSTGTGPYGTRRTTGERYVALTFDDGPDPRWTPEVLALLRAHGATATFCVVGELVEAYPGLVRRIAADGHTLCNHSWSHDIGLGTRSRAQIRADLERTTAAIRSAVPGAPVSYYRQPGGAWTRRVVEVAAALGMSSLHWAVDPQDWREHRSGPIIEAVRATTYEGAIVLLHDGGGERHGTVTALRRFLPYLADRFRLDALPVYPPRR
jgi:peptidoglycan/xylan/chitin deacetylase (PgdA/CDA1 family)